MRMLRIVMMGLAILQLALAVFIGLTSSFADGGTILERLLLGVIQPAAAILLLLMVLKVQALTKKLKYWALTLLLVNVAGDIAVAASISSGVTKGDWALPLVFSIVPAIGLIYGLTLTTKET